MKFGAVGLFIFTCFFGTLGFAQAAGGICGCALCYASRLDGTEITSTNISFRNLASQGSMAVEKIDIYQSDGTLAVSLSKANPPLGFRPSLGPHQYTSLHLPDILKFPPSAPWLQAIVSWRADSPGVSPW